MFMVGAPALLLPECETTSLGWALLSALGQHVWMWKVRAIRTSDAPTSQDCLRTWVGSCFVNSCRGKWRGRASEDWVWRAGRGKVSSNYQVMRIPLPPPSLCCSGREVRQHVLWGICRSLCVGHPSQVSWFFSGVETCQIGERLY